MHSEDHDLRKYRFGAIPVGDTFSAIHGDLFTEYFNKKVKEQLDTSDRDKFLVTTLLINKWIIIASLRITQNISYAKLPMN